MAGAGYIGLAHVEALRASPTCSLAAIVDPSPAAGKAAAEADVPLFPSIDALIREARPDGIVLATPNQLHVPQALQCIEAQLATFVEKPIAPSVDEGEKLVREVEIKRARVLVGHHRAHSPIMAKAKEVVASGVLGRVVAIMGSAAFCKPDHYFDDGPWRKQPGGGPILINMIHEVHNLRMLCGEIVAVQAIASRAVRNFPVEDTATINLQFANGALGSFMLSDTAACARSWEQTSQENKAYPTYADEDCYVIAGTNGSLSVPTMRLKTYPRPQDRSWWKPFEVRKVELTRQDPIRLQMEHFGAVARGEVEPLVSARDGLANLRVTEAITRAAATGELVRL